MSSSSSRSVFLTVGTTEFDELVSAIDTCEFVQALCAFGCVRLSVQIGRGAVEPKVLAQECATRGVSYSCFRFKDSLTDEMQRADLIISHCGAGSILEALGLHKMLIVVVNSSLQDNHQTELADALTEQGHCWSSSPSAVTTFLQGLPSLALTRPLVPFPDPDLDAFPELVDGLFDWRQKDD